MSENSSHTGGIGFLGLLGILFIALKLTGVIDWSWWWVTIPLWGGLALVLAILFVIAVVACIGTIVSGLYHGLKRG